ncbi:response regulator [Paenibacillus sp. sptzw28]|uniref:response regulator transcription factor n=1 Tax=Paenibacillus sp. sptzw28 TaxID=715179 RepID=UPI001C6E934C|nr:response regulator [Paenibacillus sp. sptzw28]QYR22862.1 response regulator [Paenibacillus sp. sptzw28]
MKLVIADDESLIRASLASMIRDMDSAWSIVGEATNGEELLELIAEHKPNIAIVDIRMPKLDGLEAIRAAKAVSPLTNWIILSGFSDFAYAQQALKLGVSEYLLKPVAPAELEKTLLHIYRDNKDYITLLNQQCENHLFALCNGLSSLNYEDRDSMLYNGRFIGSIFILDSQQTASGAAALEREFYEELRRLSDQYLVYGMNLALLSLPGGELAAVAAWDQEKGNAGEEHVIRFLEKVKDSALRRCNEAVMMTVLKTEECSGFEALNSQLEQLMQWSEIRALCGIGRSLAYRELQKEAVIPDKLEAARLLTSIVEQFQNQLHLQAQNSVCCFKTKLHKSRLCDDMSTREAARLFIRYTLGIELTGEAPTSQLVEELHKFGERMLRETKEPVPANLTDQVIQYIHEHYMDDIGIGQIAGELNVSANYLSTLFHKTTGITFVKYLTQIRMYKAKELLLNTNLQIKQVAKQVGYYSTRHFTKLFTEMFGRYPSDCRSIDNNAIEQPS